MTPTAPLIVFYNTLCPVCDGGITRQQRKMIALVKSGEVEFRDINNEPERLSEFGASLEDIRKKLHALDGDELLVGADVAIAIWARTPGERWIAKLLGNPVIRPLTHLGYNILAHFLYGWNRRKGHWS